MKKILLAAVTAGALALAAGHASAGTGSFAYNIGATSDYVFRGLSQTNGDAAIQGGIDYSNGMFYAGTWASNVSFAHDYELDLYAGVKPTAGKFSFDLGAITYQYGNKAYNTTELKAAVSHPLGKGTVGVALFDNVDYGKTYYYELNGSYPFTDKLSLSGAVGEQAVTGVKYSTANLGLTYALTSKISIDGRFSGTNIPVTPFTKAADERFSLTVKAAF